MDIIFLIVIVIIISFAFFFGKSEGRKEAIIEALGYGVWIQINKPIKMGYPDNKIIPEGIQGIVTDIKIEWGRIGIWIAEPWVSLVGSTYITFEDHFKYLEIIPLSRVSE